MSDSGPVPSAADAHGPGLYIHAQGLLKFNPTPAVLPERPATVMQSSQASSSRDFSLLTELALSEHASDDGDDGESACTLVRVYPVTYDLENSSYVSTITGKRNLPQVHLHGPHRSELREQLQL